MLLISPCAVVVCGPRWALPQPRVRLYVFVLDLRHFNVSVVPVIPAVLSGVVLGFPKPAPHQR
jgi:hypothetical protein